MDWLVFTWVTRITAINDTLDSVFLSVSLHFVSFTVSQNHSYFPRLFVAAGARRLKLCWPKNSDIPEEPIYAWCKKDDGYDELRAELLDSFLQAGKVAGW